MISLFKQEGSMAQLVVRKIEDSVKALLQRRARRNGRSMEEEVRDILRNAANEIEKPAVGLGTEIAALFKGKGYDFEVEELRGHPVRPAKFDE
jgi:plasmid stability protein